MAKTILIDDEVHGYLKAYSEDSGMKMTSVVQRALAKYFEVNGWIPPRKLKGKKAA
jgi:hypothetical protein